MSRTVQCAKLGKEMPGLVRAPFPGELGQRIFDHVSQEAWNLWMAQQTMLINEHRLSVIDPQARQFLEEKMIQCLFEGSDEKPEGYTPQA